RGISPRPAPACAAVRSSPAHSGPRTDGQPPRSSSIANERTSPSARGRLRRLATLAQEATTLTLGGAAPYAIALAVRQGELETRLAHVALTTDALRRLGLLFGGRV